MRRVIWLGLLLVMLSACQPISRSAYEGAPAPAQTVVPGGVLLELGSRYVVVTSGVGATVRAEPDPAARTIDTLKFGSVALAGAETNGADRRTWRQVESRGWSAREGMLVFDRLSDAIALAVELRVFSTPGQRAALAGVVPTPRPPFSAPAKPGEATPTPRPPVPTPTSPPPPPAPTGSRTELYGVTTREGVRRLDRPGGAPAPRPTLEPGATLVVVDRAVGPDGRRYLRTRDGDWLAEEAIALFESLSAAANAAYEYTMVGLAPGVEIDPAMLPALWLLRREPEFRYLADTIRDERIAIRVGPPFPSDKQIASYSFADRSITISLHYAEADVRLLAVALAHEATHAWEHRQGLVLLTPANCFEAELRAFRNQAAFWARLHGPNGMERATGGAEAEMNEILRLLRDDPEHMKARLVSSYGDQCGYHAPPPQTAAPEAASAPVPAKPESGTP